MFRTLGSSTDNPAVPGDSGVIDTFVMKTFLDMPAVTSGPVWEEEDHRVLDMLCSAGLVGDEDAASALLESAPFAGLRAAV